MGWKTTSCHICRSVRNPPPNDTLRLRRRPARIRHLNYIRSYISSCGRSTGLPCKRLVPPHVPEVNATVRPVYWYDQIHVIGLMRCHHGGPVEGAEARLTSSRAAWSASVTATDFLWIDDYHCAYEAHAVLIYALDSRGSISLLLMPVLEI